jgi:UDP-N-acetylglucosamine 2-epimerase (non-hydrolysing)
MSIKILTVFGTRPEAIKMSPVIQALSARRDRIRSRVCVTGQHRDMLDQALDVFSVVPDYDLNVMTKGQSSMEVFSRVMDKFEPVLQVEQPDWVLVQGDTTTTAAAALAAGYFGTDVGHIEAGLRTHDKKRPFPEEINRLVATSVADLHFAPTALARDHLIAEGIDPARILVTGNPGIDTLYKVLANLERPADDPLDGIPEENKLILVTAHRRESFGRPLENVCHALLDIANRFLGYVNLVFPVHPNSKVYDVVHQLLREAPNIKLLKPLDYQTLVYVMTCSDLILTDSGGIQEEAPSLGKPVLILREVTERPECVDAGNALLVGTNVELIVDETIRLLEDELAYEQMARPTNLYGDGQAARRIVAALLGEPVDEWEPESQTVDLEAKTR